MRRDMMTARFKRDYVAFFAIYMFIFVVIAQIAIAVWVPLLMHRQNLWVDDIARQQVHTLFDRQRKLLRKTIRTVDNTAVVGEAKMLLEQLDLLAIYLMADDRAKKLTTEQVMELREVLTRVARHVGRLDSESPRAVTLPLQLDTSAFIQSIVKGE